MLESDMPTSPTHEIEKFRIKFLYKHYGVAQSASCINAAIFIYLSWASLNPVALWTWGICFLLSAIIQTRILFWIKRNYINKVDFNPRVAEDLFALGAFITGLFWGLAACFLLPHGQAYTSLMGFILSGMSAGVAVAFCVSILSAQAFIIPAVALFALRLFLEGTVLNWGMLLMAFVFIASFTILILEINKTVIASINLRFEKDQLLRDIQSAHKKVLNSARLAALGEMASSIAHEINSPLSVIGLSNGLIEGLANRDELSQSAVRRHTDKIKATVEKIAKIIMGLTAFSREGEHDPYQQVPVKNLVHETIDLCRPRFKIESARLEVGPISNHLMVECRSVQIGQVLLNLLNNAFDAVSGCEQKWVRVDVSETPSDCMISVTDSGPGVPLEIRDKIIQPFFTTKKIGKGTGLGLSISLGIVKSHYGTLKLDTGCNNTRFVVTIPKRQEYRQAPAQVHAAT